MATTRQTEAARENIEKAPHASHTGSGSHSEGLSAAERNDLENQEFAFPGKRKEPLNDAAHVRNAIARFDQVEDVSDSEREAAWKRIKAAARKYGVDVEADSWRALMRGGRSGSR
jgi:hypothetical protein